MSTPWYQDGLPFECTRCGNCCTGAPGYVWADDDEIAAIAKQVGEPIDQVIAMYTHQARGKRSLRERPNGDCVFLSPDRGCTIYAVRPRQCRTWPFWESNVATPEAWQQTCEVCPGSGRGELISVEEITRRVKEIRL